MLARVWRNWNPCALPVGMENVMAVFQKIKNRTTIRSNNSVSRYIPKEVKTGPQKDICTPMLIAALCKIAKSGSHLIIS